MAVQAQYPSNVLLLNNRNGQEGNDYTTLQQQQQQQQQPGTGALINQSHMYFFNNGVDGGTNLRKRGRGESLVGNGVGSATLPINLFSQQPQQAPSPTTLINLPLLHNQQPPPPPNVSTGLRLASSSSSSFMSDDLSAQMKQHRDEIDQLLQLQGDQLRRTLAERRERHYRTLVSAAGELAARRLKDKEAEVEKAARKNAELEALMVQIRGEAQVWQLKARTHEAHVASLQAQLQQAVMVCGVQHKEREQQEKEEQEGEAEDAESAHIDPQRVMVSQNGGGGGGGPICKACRVRVASVVLLPCRHLCLCTNCDSAVEACPLCLSYRSASVQVFLS